LAGRERVLRLIRCVKRHPNDRSQTSPTAARGLLRLFGVVSSRRSTGLWHRRASSGCFRDFDPTNGRGPMSAAPQKAVGSDAIFRLPVRPAVTDRVSSRASLTADLDRPGPRDRKSASWRGLVLTLAEMTCGSRRSAFGQSHLTGSLLVSRQTHRCACEPGRRSVHPIAVEWECQPESRHVRLTHRLSANSIVVREHARYRLG
jgi:hypothetical protein